MNLLDEQYERESFKTKNGGAHRSTVGNNNVMTTEGRVGYHQKGSLNASFHNGEDKSGNLSRLLTDFDHQQEKRENRIGSRSVDAKDMNDFID